MKKIEFKVPIYDWEITVVTLHGPEDVNDFRTLLTYIDAEKSAAEKTLLKLQKGYGDGGDFWYDVDKRKALIDVFPWSNYDKFWEILNHEKRHLIDRIMEHALIRDSEAAAHLDGFVSKEIFPRLKELTT